MAQHSMRLETLRQLLNRNNVSSLFKLHMSLKLQTLGHKENRTQKPLCSHVDYAIFMKHRYLQGVHKTR
uniref:Uncharacterized protein n=1 Tax=Arundo donax TaxID=35708 RepID=A0A0A9HMM5_ARUDO